MKLSIVTTLYYSSSYINEFYEKITKEVKKITNEYEIIFVDDGSPDNSLQKAIELYKKDDKVKIIELSRNFGHHKAIMTGLKFAKGEYIFLIDSDLEEPPKLLEKFWKEMQKEPEIDVIYGVQEKRKGDWFERWSGQVFYKLFNFLADINLPPNIVTVRLMKKKYVKALIKHQDKQIFLAGLWFITGFKQKSIIVKKFSHSPSTYNLKKKILILFNSITSFSVLPLKFIFLIGFIISILSLICIIFILYKKLFLGITIYGWASLMISIWFIGGIILICIGLIGLYISNIFMEVKKRPYTIIRNYYDKKNNK